MHCHCHCNCRRHRHRRYRRLHRIVQRIVSIDGIAIVAAVVIVVVFVLVIVIVAANITLAVAILVASLPRRRRCCRGIIISINSIVVFFPIAGSYDFAIDESLFHSTTET